MLLLICYEILIELEYEHINMLKTKIFPPYLVMACKRHTDLFHTYARLVDRDKKSLTILRLNLFFCKTLIQFPVVESLLC